jgi:glycine/D-amino acid oxidase-like deaminating enzyme
MSRAHEVVVIVGGAIMGSFVAFYLRELDFDGSVIVLERDPTYRRSSTALSAASIRTQFGCPVNVRMSLFGAEFLRSSKLRWDNEVDVGFVESGYLILGAQGTSSERIAAARMQNEEGADIRVMTATQAHSLFSWLNTDDVEVASYGARHEGWFDAWSLLQGVRNAAKRYGVEYRRADVSRIELKALKVSGVCTSDGGEIAADWVVNAAGAASAALMRPHGIELPVTARKRTVFRVKTPLHAANFPMLFDSSGAWIRPEGDGFIAGIAPPAAKDGDADGDFEPAWELFEEVLWPALAHRVPAFQELRVDSAWAGHYEINLLDHNGIVGPHDEISNLLFATGFSGHGVMHAPATGRAIAEHILHGGYQTLDLASLGYSRIRSRTPMHEAIVY